MARKIWACQFLATAAGAEALTPFLNGDTSVARRIVGIVATPTALVDARVYRDRERVVDVLTNTITGANQPIACDIPLPTGVAAAVGIGNRSAGAIAVYDMSIVYDEPD